MNVSVVLMASLALTIGAEPKPEQLAKVREELKSPKVEVRLAAIKQLIHSDLSDHLNAEMQACFKDTDGDVRSVAATAVGNLGAKAEGAIPALVAQLGHDKFKEARETAARALGRIGKALPENHDAEEPLRKAAANDEDPVTRTVALGALAMLNKDVPGQIIALRKYLHHDEMLVRMKAAHALGMIGLPAKSAAPEIAEILPKETDGHRRGYIARSLGNTGDPNSLPVLMKALKAETDDAAKGEMRGAIQKLGGKP
ncbi:HEAT repeat domain-containing protein [Zavarzinella formosa]|uniref:HEAT repeat domain-containing protein n=1 Tax=Zavarzinella formosa TaxID=360055 RepID=UPI0002DAEB00|nr:HEAT repeat domain-containing protein [Zavarzinella formosa]